MTAKTEKGNEPEPKAEAKAQDAPTPQQLQVPEIHVHGQPQEATEIALARIRCECLKLATDPNAYDQRPKLEKAQEMFDWVIDPDSRIEAKTKRPVQTQPVNYGTANLPEQPQRKTPAAGRAGEAVDWSQANT